MYKHVIFYIGISLLLAMHVPLKSYAQEATMTAASTTDASPSITITWTEEAGVARYNLYRKALSAPSFPNTPLNPVPISVMSEAAAIQVALNGVGSYDWNLVVEGLSDSGNVGYNPLNVSSIEPGSEKENRLRFLARMSYRIALIAGQGYQDAGLTSGQTYQYRLASVAADGSVLDFLDTLTITAGVYTPLPAPTGLIAQGGDQQILLRWDENPQAAGYVVLRSTIPGPGWFYRQINERYFASVLTQDLAGDTLMPNQPGYLDVLHWKPGGHHIDTTTITDINGVELQKVGPLNGINYYYRVYAVDLLGRGGAGSGVVSSSAQDTTPPASPAALTVIPDENASAFIIRWNHVLMDIKGHKELDSVQRYALYRYTTPDSPQAPHTLVGWLSTPPIGTMTVDTIDTGDPATGLRDDYQRMTWYYRVAAMDDAGNIGPMSAAVAGTLDDTTRPEIVMGLLTEGFADHIAMTWNPNTEPDIMNYEVYRSLCHRDRWIPCRDSSRYDYGYDPYNGAPTNGYPGTYYDQLREYATPNMASYEKYFHEPRPCSGPFVLVGEITHDSLLQSIEEGHMAFEDHTLPLGSPLCYAYWIKALDNSRNMSGGWPLPWIPAERDQIVCERLRDETPPEPAIIAELLARDNAIQIEFVGPPMQDIYAYHVYRAPYMEPTNFTWIGGITVDQPGQPSQPLTEPFQGLEIVACGQIPLSLREDMSVGTFIDFTADPHEPYYYKVTGIDLSGNESPIESAAEVGTFTFSTTASTAPNILNIATVGDPCALEVVWDIAYDSEQHVGAVLFKSQKVSGPYYQVGAITQEQAYQDVDVIEGTTYWYRVAMLHLDGSLSQLSPPTTATPIK